MDTVNTIFMGSEGFSLPILHALTAARESGISLRAVVTHPDRPAGRGHRMKQSPVRLAAASMGIAAIQPERLRTAESVAEVLSFRPDLIVVASFGQIVPQSILDYPRHGSLNLHPSLLPAYRGASPVSTPILAGDVETGVTLMLLVARMDAGPIIAQERTRIEPDETAGELEVRLAALSADLLTKYIGSWLQGTLAPVPQDERYATYTSRLQKADGLVDWSNTAPYISRQVRAFNPWPGAFTLWKGQTVKLLAAHPVDGNMEAGKTAVDEQGEFIVGTGAGLLALDTLQLPGGRAMPAREAIRGHVSLVGTTFGSVAA